MTDNSGPAFPLSSHQPGMTLRDWFAGQALAGIVANSLGKQSSPEHAWAFGAYTVADAMLAARKGQDDE